MSVNNGLVWTSKVAITLEMLGWECVMLLSIGRK